MQLGHQGRKALKKAAKQDMYNLQVNFLQVGFLGVLLIALNLGIALAIVQIPNDNLESLIGNLSSLVMFWLFNSALVSYFLIFQNKEKYASVWQAFNQTFTKCYIHDIFAVSMMSAIYSYLWSLLLIIPGIIKEYSYSQSIFLVASVNSHGHKISFNTALNQSSSLMDGHKYEYFVLRFSLIGWTMLAILTCGIALFWVVPYKYAVLNRYYQYVLAAKQAQINSDLHYYPKWFNLKTNEIKPTKKFTLNDLERENIAEQDEKDFNANHNKDHFEESLKGKTAGDIIDESYKNDENCKDKGED